MPSISKAKYEYEVAQHEKRAERRRIERYHKRSLKCRLGFHFAYNLTGYPMLEVPPRCWYCEEPLEDAFAATPIKKFNKMFKQCMYSVYKIFKINRVKSIN